MQVTYGVPADVENWMCLVKRIRPNFPGLETEESLDEHKATVLKFIRKRQAVCVKVDGEIVGILLFSRGHNMICCLGVSPEHRRCGIASILLTEALDNLDRSKDITVSTFREEDEKGSAPRALYKKFGFEEDDLTVDLGYPTQRFVLKRRNNG